MNFLFQIIEKKKKACNKIFFEVESKFIDNLINKIIMFGKIMIIKKKIKHFHRTYNQILFNDNHDKA